MVKVNQDASEHYARQFQDLGRTIGDKYSDKFTDVAGKLMEDIARKQGQDLQQTADEEGMTVRDLVWNSDEFMELTVLFAEQFMEGLSEMWPYPVGYDTRA